MRCRTALGVLVAAAVIAVYRVRLQYILLLNGTLFGSLIVFAIPGLMYLV